MIAVSADDLFEALANAHAITGEFDTIEGKLAAVGLDVDAVHEVLRDRWAAMKAEDAAHSDEESFCFVRGFVEGLLVGRKL